MVASQSCCYTPVTNCLLHDNDNSCTQCLPYFYLQSATACVACDASCAVCSGSGSNQCQSCKDSNKNIFPVTTGTCICIDANCLNCAASTPFCSTCKPLYYFDAATTYRCQPCHASCSSCTGPSSNQCIACLDSNKSP